MMYDFINLNIDIYNANIKRYKQFVIDLENKLIDINENLVRIFQSVKSLSHQIHIDFNYDTGVRDWVLNLTTIHYITFLKLLQDKISNLMDYCRKIETYHKRTAWILKRVCWVFRGGLFYLEFIDGYIHDEEITNHLQNQAEVAIDTTKTNILKLIGNTTL